MAIASHFELGPLILAAIEGLALPGLVTVDDETRLAGVSNDLAALLPAAILFAEQGDISEGTDGRVQTEVQFWRVSVIVPHYRRAAGDTATTASVAGAYLYPIARALVGQSLHVDFRPLEIVERPAPEYFDGEAVFDLVFKTSFLIEGA